MVGDSLYFTSYSDKVMGKTDSKLRKKAYYDLYRAGLDGSGNTTSNRQPIEEFVTKYHDGPVVWSARTGELFVTQSENLEATPFVQTWRADTVRLRITIARQVKGKWDSVTDFPYNNPAYSVGHPAITVTGDTLIFSSDKPGGYGQTDLYCTIRKNGVWGAPVNLGPEINTSGKDEFPFIYNDPQEGMNLIFSSTGRGGAGGLDLYYTKFPVGKGSPVIHCEAPLNTTSDDFAMIIRSNTDYGYFTSNRPGKGDDDIYKFTFTRIDRSFIRELFVLDSKTHHPVAGAKLFSCDKKEYLGDNMGKTPIPGFDRDCEIKAIAFGYYDKATVLKPRVSRNLKLVRDTIWMDPVMKKPIVLHNIYYDFDKWDILPESATELDQLVSYMKENPTYKVELSSHTDSRGSHQYNDKLSQRRAESAVNYVVSHGIDASRITAKGYGETKPVNKCTNGKRCTPAEYRQNRRTEIVVTGVARAEDVIQTKGNYSQERKK